MPARRAHGLLFLIESRTAHLAARTRAALDLVATEAAARERDLAFVQAFSLGRDPPLRPTIHDLERHAPTWAALVPENPSLRAAIAHLLGEKYRFTWRATPGIREALGLDDDAVHGAYQRLYGHPLGTIFVARPTPAERLRWASAALGRRFRALPPFWLATALTLTLGLSLTPLATPIAVADVGPLAGVGLIAALGLVNMLTMACMAEAVARSGSVRYGGAFLGRLAADYLGATGSLVLTAGTASLFFLVLLASSIGMVDALGSLTPVPPAVWAALLLGVGLHVLARGSLNLSVSLQVLLATINVVLIVVLSAVALLHLRAENLLYLNVPFIGGRPFEPMAAHRLLGVILVLYFAQVLTIRIGAVVLPRDPSARSLIWGSVAGTAASAALFCLWTAAVSGALGREVAGYGGTVATPLAATLGPIGGVLGSLLVFSVLGQTALRTSALLFSLVRERLPAAVSPVVVLPRRRGQLVFRVRGSAAGDGRIGVTYLGHGGGEPRFRLDAQGGGDTLQVEQAASGDWDIAVLLAHWPALGERRFHLVLQVVDTAPERAVVRVDSSLAMEYGGDWVAAGRAAAERIALPDDGGGTASRLSRRGRFLASISPVLLVFLLTEWALLAGTSSFARVLDFTGVVAISLITGIVPVLLLYAARRKGELVPGAVFGPLGHPIMVAAVYALFVANIFAHGLFIWTDGIERVGAVASGLLIVGATVVMIRRGAFARRAVLELRADGEDRPLTFALVAGGRPATAEIRLEGRDGERRLRAASGELPTLSSCRSLTVDLPPGLAPELKVWAHRRGPVGDAEGLAAILEVDDGRETRRFDLKLAGGQVLLRLDGGPPRLRVTPSDSGR